MPNLELVQWIDAISDLDWAPGDNDLEPSKCSSVGIVLKDAELHITLGGDWSKDDKGILQTNTRMCIPKGCITLREIIREV